MEFEVIGTISDIEIIAVGKTIRELGRLRRVYGSGRWRNSRGSAWFAWLMVLWATRSYIGMKLTVSENEI